MGDQFDYYVDAKHLYCHLASAAAFLPRGAFLSTHVTCLLFHMMQALNGTSGEPSLESELSADSGSRDNQEVSARSIWPVRPHTLKQETSSWIEHQQALPSPQTLLQPSE